MDTTTGMCQDVALALSHRVLVHLSNWVADATGTDPFHDLLTVTPVPGPALPRSRHRLVDTAPPAEAVADLMALDDLTQL